MCVCVIQRFTHHNTTAVLQMEEALGSFTKGAKIDPDQQLFAGKMNLGRGKGAIFEICVEVHILYVHM